MTCPSNPAPPDGYRVWRGAVPAPLVDWAVSLRDHIRGFPYGQVWSMELGGRTVLARKDYHTWTFKGGQLVRDICIPGVTLYEPKAPPTVSGLGALADDDLSTPDPEAAVFSEDDRIDWGLVGWTAASVTGAVVLFFAALHGAGSAARR